MKVIVIGIDGLEYNLVRELGLKALMQNHYDKLEIPRECFIETDTGAVPYTPKVWEAILTGNKPDPEETKTLWRYRNPLIERLRWIPLLRRFKGKRRLLKKIGFKPMRVSFKISGETFLDRCKPSIGINIPGVNIWEERNRRITELIDKGSHKTLMLIMDRYLNDVFSEFEERLQEMDYRVAMMYINNLDYIGHLCWYKCFEKIIRLYKKVDAKVDRLLKKLDYDVSLIVSDHGMKGSSDGVSGEHSSYLFYSLNIEYRFESIYDISRKIIEWSECR